MPRKSVFYCVPRAASTTLLVTQNPAAFSGNSQGQQLQRGSEVMTGENSSGKKIWLCRKFLTYVGQEEEPESKPSPWLRIGGENASGGTTGDENAKVPGEAELSVPVQRNHQRQDHRSLWKAQMLIFNLQTSEFFRESGWSEQPKAQKIPIWGEIQQLKEFIPCFWWGCEGKGISSPGNWSGSTNINRGEAHKQIFTAPRGQLLCLLLTTNPWFPEALCFCFIKEGRPSFFQVSHRAHPTGAHLGIWAVLRAWKIELRPSWQLNLRQNLEMHCSIGNNGPFAYTRADFWHQ